MLESDAIILYDSDNKPLPRELQSTYPCNIKLQNLAKVLFLRELELYKRLMEVTDNEP